MMGLLTDCDGPRSNVNGWDLQVCRSRHDVGVETPAINRGGQLRGVGRRGEFRVNRNGVGSYDRIRTSTQPPGPQGAAR